MFELYNAHPGVHSFGNAHRPNLEQVWDALLEKKMTIYGVSSDDAHKLQKWGEKENNPGRGWVMVKSEELSSDAIPRPCCVEIFTPPQESCWESWYMVNRI